LQSHRDWCVRLVDAQLVTAVVESNGRDWRGKGGRRSSAVHIRLVENDHYLHRAIVGNVARGGITWWRRGHHVAKRLRGKRKARGPTVGERQRLVESVVVGRVGDREARRELSHMKRDLRGVNVERLFTFHELFG